MSDNITLPREVVQDALDALTGADDFSPGGTPIYMQEITALRNYLAAEQQEPVAKACWACNGKGCLRDIDTAGLLPCVVCKPQQDKT